MLPQPGKHLLSCRCINRSLQPESYPSLLTLLCPALPSLQPGSSPQRQRRQLDPRARQSEFKGLLSSFTGEDDDGLLDVRFERRGKGSSGGSSGKDAGARKRR